MQILFLSVSKNVFYKDLALSQLIGYNWRISFDFVRGLIVPDGETIIKGFTEVCIFDTQTEPDYNYSVN